MLKIESIWSFLLCFFLVQNGQAQDRPNDPKRVMIEPGEKWFGAAVTESDAMPFTDGYSFDLHGNTGGNQAAPLLLSTNGRFIWSEKPFSFQFTKGYLQISAWTDSVYIEKTGKTLSEAYGQASRKYFPASGKMPDSVLFTHPQYNTWIELVYNQNQKDILKYAHDIISNGFPPGVLMIDDNWGTYYGKFEFRKDRFPDPAAMMNELHQLGFKVMLWVCPFISPDGEVFRELAQKKLLLVRQKEAHSTKGGITTEPAIINWWNGYSAVMDFSNPEAVSWYDKQLTGLVDRFGIDGFKFDAGDPEFYPASSIPFKKVNANEQSELWGLFGLQYPLNEYRAMWKRGGQPLAERLRDKSHSWEDLQKLIPHITTSGLLGYAFACPDMIGGGEFGSFIGKDKLDQDLIVRSAQCSALMPMMQFSVAPWRVLDDQHLKAVHQSVGLREKFVPYILRLVHNSAMTGVPIVRKMEFVFPHQGFEACKDQFMLGDSILVAPVITKGTKRLVLFPKGKWVNDAGVVFNGPSNKEMDAPLETLLWFRRL
jgi:alpha-glucosidase